jgi:glycosyltransferase involved in cell wall biosynthesis
MEQPLVSVVMPVFNSEKYADDAIRSVLCQTFRDFEFIIVNDRSTDGSLALLEKWAKKDRRIVLVQNRARLGISGSRNAGLAHAKGKLIMNMDHDDVCHPERMHLQAHYLSQNPEVGIVGSDIDVINDAGKTIGERHFPQDDAAIRQALLQSSPFTHPSTMVRSSAYARAGKYNKEFEPADDYELYFRIGRAFKFGNISAHLLKHRIHGGATTMKKTRLMVCNTLKAKWRGAFKLGYTPGAMAAIIAIGQMALLPMPSFVLEKIVLSQYRRH